MLTLEVIENEISHVIAHGNNQQDIALLADLFICRSQMQPEDTKAVLPDKLAVESQSEFASCINGRCFSDILPVIEELLNAVAIINPRLYNNFIRRLREN